MTRFVLSVALLAAASPLTASAAATLRIRVVDASTGRPLPCTVQIRTATGEVLQNHASFRDGIRSPGTLSQQVPSGRTAIAVSRGFDYGALRQEIELRDGETRDLDFRLTRRTPLRALRWYAGDNHDHMVHGERTIDVDFAYVALAAKAEGLDYLSVTNHWNTPDASPEALERICARASSSDFLLLWNLEAPKNYWKGNAAQCIGHGWTLGMKGRTSDGRDAIQELLAMSAWDYESEKASFPNFEIHAFIRNLGGIVSYTHPHRWWWGKWGGQGGYPVQEKMRISNMAAELPLDTVIGPTYDTIDIMMQPQERETARQAQELWFLLLNHGYRMAATASSDTTFDRPGGGIPGKVRLYTHVDGSLTGPALARAVKEGRSFITSGPLVLFDIDGHGPGHVVKADGARKHTLNVRAWPSGAYGSRLHRVELIRNGVVVDQWSPTDSLSEFTASREIAESGTAWYLVRCFGEAPNEIAITNPVYFEGADYRAPTPASAHVTAFVTNSKGEPLNGTMSVIQMDGRKPVKTAEFPIVKGKFEATVSPTSRLEVSVPGYTPSTKSIFMDYAPLLDKVLNITPAQISDWNTFEEFRQILREVRLEFQVQPASSVRKQ